MPFMAHFKQVKTGIGTTFVIGTREVYKRDKTAEVKCPKMAIVAYVICSERSLELTLAPESAQRPKMAMVLM